MLGKILIAFFAVFVILSSLAIFVFNNESTNDDGKVENVCQFEGIHVPFMMNVDSNSASLICDLTITKDRLDLNAGLSISKKTFNSIESNNKQLNNLTIIAGQVLACYLVKQGGNNIKTKVFHVHLDDQDQFVGFFKKTSKGSYWFARISVLGDKIGKFDKTRFIYDFWYSLKRNKVRKRSPDKQV